MKPPHILCVLILTAAMNFTVLAAADHGGNQTAKIYSARGIVKQIAPGRRQVTIQHEAIAGYMMAMTMDFPVKTTNELNGISLGDEITFQLAVRPDDDWVENIRLVAHHAADTNSVTPVSRLEDLELKPGDLLPDGELTAEDGRTIRFSDFRGKALAFTFFFTRCPLPDYCLRMNRNFAATRKLLQANAYAPTNWEFLSVSFDSGFDKPAVLTSYAGIYRGSDTDRWLFAAASTNVLTQVAPRLDLIVMRQGNSISHNLRTVVLDTHGKIFKQFDGNTWTPEQLEKSMIKAAAD